ncbi:hypothetical protein ACOSQ2_023057 [Xanthoceras sorbifolium]
MDADEIDRLCETLLSTDIDGPIIEVDGEDYMDGIRDVNHCLVGKVLSKKRVNRDAFRMVIENLWNPIGRVEVEAVGENLFVFHFRRVEERALVWARGPWFAKLLAERIGTVVEIPAEPKDCRGKFLWVRVGIDVTKPLKRGLKVKLEDLLVAASIKYERLPEFYFACGLLGHELRDCDDETARREALEGSSTKFGSWLRTALLERLRPNFQRSGGQDRAKRENKGVSSDDG